MATTAPHLDQPSAKKMKKDDFSPLVGSYPTSDLLIRTLLSTKVENVRPPENTIFIAQRTDKITDVWKGLVLHNFYSVPVLQKTKKKWYGFVDMFDIVKFVISFFGESESLKSSEDWIKMAECSEEFKTKTVNDIMKYPLSKANPFFPVHTGYSLLSAVEVLAREPGLHRIPIIDRDRKLITIITQSQLTRLLIRNMELFGEKKNKPVSQLDRYLEDVFTIPEEATAMDAFRLMIEKNVTGLAVINKEGKLTDNISLKDLKAMSTDARLFWRLYQTVHNFLQKIRKENNETGGDRPRRAVTVTRNDTLEMVLKKLDENNVHRIFICDGHKPIGVISLRDVLNEIIH